MKSLLEKIDKQKVIVVMIITLLLFDSFSVTLLSIAANGIDEENILYEVSFVDDDGNNQEMIEKKMNDSNIKLKFKLGVRNIGFFNGEIKLNNNNFKFDTNFQDEHISSISEDSITLNQVNAGDEFELEINVVPIKDDDYNVSMLNSETDVELTGDYVIGENQSKSIDVQKKLKLSLVFPYDVDDEEALNLNAETVTNKVYNINGENKRIYQIQLQSSLNGNVYPVKSTNITLDVPDGVEDVQVAKRGTFATNNDKSDVTMCWHKDEKNVDIEILNEESDGKVQWNKTQKDTVLVTYVMDSEAVLDNLQLNVNDDVILCDESSTLISKSAVVSDIEEKDGAILYTKNATNEQYKGYLYYGEDTSLDETTSVDIRYPKISNKISVTEGSSIYEEAKTDGKASKSKANVANGQYISTTVNVDELLDVIGEKGSVQIKDVQGNVLTTISESTIEEREKELEQNVDETDVSEDPNMEFTYAPQSQIVIDILDAEEQGVINFSHKKTLNETTYSKDQLKQFTDLKVSGILNSAENVGEKAADAVSNLLEPQVVAKFTSNTSSLSTVQKNENVQFNVVLKTDDIKYELYKNPTVQIVFPKEIVNVDAQINPVFVDGLAIKEQNVEKNADGNYVIKIVFNGEQIKHSNNISEGIVINVSANIEVDESAPTQDVDVLLHYTNENDGNTVHEEKVTMNIKAKDELSVETSDDEIENASENGAKPNLNEDNTSSDETSQSTNDTIKEASMTSNFAKAAAVVTKDEQGLQISSQTFLGVNEISSDTEVFGGEILKYVISVKNTSNADISNLQVKANQENGTLYDLEEVQVTNSEVMGDDTAFTEHKYSDLTTSEKTFDVVQNLKIGASTTFEYQVRVDNSNENNETYGKITVKADGIDEVTAETQKNKIKNGEIKVTLENSAREELKRYAGDSNSMVMYIKNTDDKDKTNVVVNVYLSDNLYMKENSQNVYFYKYINDELDSDASDLIDVSHYDAKENILTFTISKISKNEEIQATLLMFSKETETDFSEDTVAAHATAEIGKNTYYSNEVSNKIYPAGSNYSVDYKILDPKEEGYQDGDEVKFEISMKNLSNVTCKYSFVNEIGSNFEIQSIKKKVEDCDEEDITKEMSENNMEYYQILGADDEVKVTETAKVVYPYDEDRDLNLEANFYSENGSETKNISLKLAGKEEYKASSGGVSSGTDSGNENNNGNNSNNNSTNSSNGNSSNNSASTDNSKKTISGMIWNDSNRNGQKDSNERGIGGVEVRLFTESGNLVKDDSGNVIKTTTDNNGKYSFNVNSGNYMVIFLYDSDKYTVTDYKKNGVAEDSNNDAISKDINIDNTTKEVGLTDKIDVTQASASNIDMGIYERDKFDFALKKGITKVSVQTSKSSKQYSFQNQNLAKVEIRAKEIAGSKVVVEYEIKVVNEGDVDGYASDVVDYIPEGFTFNSELNKDWYVGTDKNLHNTSLKNDKIKAGESRTLKLVLTKNIATANGETTVNTAELYKVANSANTKDVDSTPGNKVASEDDLDKATLIISISTGLEKKIFLIVVFSVIILAGCVVVLKRGGHKNEKNSK